MGKKDGKEEEKRHLAKVTGEVHSSEVLALSSLALHQAPIHYKSLLLPKYNF